jgi:hypothetical protein
MTRSFRWPVGSAADASKPIPDLKPPRRKPKPAELIQIAGSITRQSSAGRGGEPPPAPNHKHGDGHANGYRYKYHIDTL